MTRTTRGLSIATLLTCITLLLATPRAAWALPCHDELYQYYSDSSYQTLVGYWGMDCSGAYHESGGHWDFGPPPHLTEYFVQSEACCDNCDPEEEYGCSSDYYDCTYAPCPPTFPSRPW